MTPVATLRERVYQVFGSQILDELVELGVRERDLLLPPPSVPPSQAIAEYRSAEPEEPPMRRFRLSGFVSRPQVQKANRNSIYIFVNGRLIRDRLLLHAISSAYHNLMPPSAYPFALLFLECDSEEVDVNVHPSKTEVRFRHGSFVHDFVRDTHSRAADGEPARALVLARRCRRRRAAGGGLPYSEFTQMIENEQPVASGWSSRHRRPAAARRLGDARDPTEPAMPEFTLRASAPPAPRLDFSAPPIAVTPGPPPSGKLSRRLDTHGEFPPDAIPAPEMSLSALTDLRPLGQIHESFIIAAGRDGLWIIDQHVAHERILFEKVLKQRAAGRVEMQRLLMPLILQLTPSSRSNTRASPRSCTPSGFETEPFGNRTIAVKAAPAAVAAADLEKDPVRDSGDRRERAARRRRSTICGAISARRSPAAPPSRSTCGWIRPRWSGCCGRWPPRIAR